MKTATQIIAVLRERGYRITESRVAVVTLLAETKGVLSMVELTERYEGDHTNVYRTIDMLQKEGLLEVVQAPGAPNRFALKTHHHHHIVCEQCHTVAAVPCGEVGAPKIPAEFSALHRHEVTFYGLCKRCAV